jgi:arginase
MPLAVIAGLAGPRWREATGLAAAVPGDRMLLLGVRELDDAEEQLLTANQVVVRTAAEIRDADALAAAIEQLAAKCRVLYVNIDLDVLDPRFVPSSPTPSGNGLEVDRLDEIVTAVLSTGKVVAVSVTSLNPMRGERGQTSSDSAWRVVEHILNSWTSVPAPTTSATG